MDITEEDNRLVFPAPSLAEHNERVRCARDYAKSKGLTDEEFDASWRRFWLQSRQSVPYLREWPKIWERWVANEQTQTKETKCKICNRLVRPECLWTSCPWKDNWPKTTLT